MRSLITRAPSSLIVRCQHHGKMFPIRSFKILNTFRSISALTRTDLFIKQTHQVPQMRNFTFTSRLQKNMVTVTFIGRDGVKQTVQVKEGDTFLDAAVNNDVDLEGFGACEGTLSCSTCHVVFKKEDFDKLPSKPTDEELDMLDLAYGLCDTSRLGCQVQITKDMQGIEVRVPEGVNDARAR